MQEVEDVGSAVGGGLLDLLASRPLDFRRLPVGLLSREQQKAAELARVQQLRAATAAYEAELVLGLADDSPDDDDLPPGTPGARSWKPDTELPGCRSSFPRSWPWCSTAAG